MDALLIQYHILAAHNETGKKGEALALNFIQKSGYFILETNWRYLKSELDIIAMDDNELAIIEVKTRSTDYFGEPEDAVDEQKQKQLIAGAAAYIEQNEIDANCRYDIVSVILSQNKPVKIKHIKDAFSPQWI